MNVIGRIIAPPRRELFLLSVVLAVALWASAFWLLHPLDAPAAGDWRDLEQYLRAHWRPADAIVVRPWWAARARQYLGDLDFVPVRHPEREDWSTHARLWVVALPGHQHLGGPFADGSFPRRERRRFGPLWLYLYSLGRPVEVVYDLRGELEQARVSMGPPGRRQACSRWLGDRWQCTPRDWNYVGRMIVELGQDPRSVIWAHPPEVPLHIEYPRVPGGRELLLHTGFTPPAARTPGGAPVTLAVQMDGRELGRIVQPNESGYFPHRFDISALGPGPHRLTLTVTTPNPGMRHFCFDGQVRR